MTCQDHEIYFVIKVTFNRIKIFQKYPQTADLVIDNIKFYRNKFNLIFRSLLNKN